MSMEAGSQFKKQSRLALVISAGVVIASFLPGCTPAAQNTHAGSMAQKPAQQQLPQQQTNTSNTIMAKAQQDVDYFLQQRHAEPSKQQADRKPAFYGDTQNVSTNSNQPQVGHNQYTQQQAHINEHSEQPKRRAVVSQDIIWNEPPRATSRAATPYPVTDPNAQTESSSQWPKAASGQRVPRMAAEDSSQPEIVNQPLYRLEPGGQDRARSQGEQSLGKVELPTTASQAGRLNQLLGDVSSELYRNATQTDMPLRELMLIAAMSLLDPDSALNAQAIPNLSDRDREVLAEMQQFFATLGKDLESTEDTEETLRNAIEQLKQSLDRQPPFGIKTAELCMRVRGFGDFDSFDKRSFLAMAEQRAIVYIELENFASKLNEQNEWVTELSQELVIYSDRDGIPVWSETWQRVVDVTRNRRHDFFTVQLITFPKALSVGRYYLKVRMRDEQSSAIAEQTIQFEMVADPRMASQGH